MTLVLVLLLVVFVLTAYLFFAPFYLELDSTRELCRFRFHRLMALTLKTRDHLSLEVSVLGWKAEFRLSAGKPGKKQGEKKPVKQKRSTAQLSANRVKRFLKSFRITRCYVRIGLDDMQLNGILYPAVAWLSWYTKKDIQVSFTGSNVMILEIKNNLARMSWAWFGSK